MCQRRSRIAANRDDERQISQPVSKGARGFDAARKVWGRNDLHFFTKADANGGTISEYIIIDDFWSGSAARAGQIEYLNSEPV